MSQEMLVALAKEVARDWQAQQRFEALSDRQLAGLGLDAGEIRSIWQGFFDQVLRLGLTLDDSAPQPPGCCFG
jgi:hypothetical protein